MVCYSYLFQNFPQFIVIHTFKGFGIVNKGEIDGFVELSCLFDYPVDVGNWSLIPLSFLKPAWTSGSSRFTYCWSLAWRILSITLLACVQFSSLAQSCQTLYDPINCSTPGLPVHHQLLELTQTHVHRVGDVIQPSHPLSSPSPPAPIPLSIRVFSSESTLHMRWPKYWSFSFRISPSKELPGLISFRMNWLDVLAVQGTLKSLLQHHSSKASILQHSAFFTVQLSYPYMTTGKTIALTRQTFVGQVVSRLFNMLSRLVTTFLVSCRQINFISQNLSSSWV